MQRRGFTTVEIVITITIMGILLVLAFANLTASQARARDEERRGDIDSIAQHLESFYKNGAGVPGEQLGRYPSTAIMTSESTMRAALVNIDPRSLQAPGASSSAESFIAATSSTQTTAGILPQPTTANYVYQPLSWNGSNWTLCTGSQECRRFNLYYRLETDNVIYKVTSKNQ